MNKQIDEMARELAENLAWDEDEIPTVDCLETAKRLYNAGYRKQSEWIPVTERLPELFEDVLCYYPNKKGKSKVRVDYLEDKEERSFGFEFCEGKVTHWMPLPPPPEAEKGR